MKRAVLALLLVLTACGAPPVSGSEEPVELTVFAAASLTEALEEIAERYQVAVPGVTLTFNFDSSGTLQRQIQEGAACDLFLSAAPKQMDALDGSLTGDEEKNPDGLDLIDTGSRVDLLENKVVLAVPEGNPGEVQSFDGLAERLVSGDVLLAMGGGDVPAGQYARRILAYYGAGESTVGGCITYGSNVKEVTTQLSEAAADCGVIYATDAFSAGLSVVDEATAEMCGQVIYPAAVLKDSGHHDEAADFLAYLGAANGGAPVFEAAGFTVLSK